MSFRNTLRLRDALLALVLVPAACDLPTDPDPPRDRVPPAFEISDGARGGNAHFYFLQPMVKPPAAFGGTFDPTLAPEVVICAWSNGACSGPVIAHFTTAGAGPAAVRVEPGEEYYIVDWQTDGLDPDVQVRVRVLVDDIELGYADIAIGATGGALRNVDTDEYIPLVDGRTLPIRFRIEEGAVTARGLATVSAGSLHTCGISLAGRAYCWGEATSGVLGHGSNVADSNVPVAVSTSLTFDRITAGLQHTCALTPQGEAWCWGNNDKGSLGDGTQMPRLAPSAVAGGLTFASISVGQNHTCGVTPSHQAYCWGYNGSGELGTQGVAPNVWDAVVQPDPVAGDIAFAQVSAGPSATCGVSVEGQAYCWGFNDYGRLGTGSDVVHTAPAPVLQPAGVSFASVDLGGLTACALEADGTAWCWGINELGSAGVGEHYTMLLEPEPVAPATSGESLKFSRLSVGYGHACGIDMTGQAWCWGFNPWGQAGPTMVANYGPPQPTAVPGAVSMVEIAAGENHTCGVTSNGQGLCWGDNAWGQLGNGTMTSSATPVLVVESLF